MSLLQKLLKRFKKTKKTENKVNINTEKQIDPETKKMQEKYDEELLRQLLDPRIEGVYVVDPEKIAQKHDVCESEYYIMK